MHLDISSALKGAVAQSSNPERLNLAFGRACAQRVRHLLEDDQVVECLQVLERYLSGGVDRAALTAASAQAASLANHHQGSRSLDGVGHAAVSASYAVAHALAGRPAQAAEYAAYAMVYGGGGYGAVNDPDSFVPEHHWQRAMLEQLEVDVGSAERAA